jgi:hypothetical protein
MKQAFAGRGKEMEKANMRWGVGKEIIILCPNLSKTNFTTTFY